MLEFASVACMCSIEITADDLREIDAAPAQIPVRGARYPDHLQGRFGRGRSVVMMAKFYE